MFFRRLGTARDRPAVGVPYQLGDAQGGGPVRAREGVVDVVRLPGVGDDGVVPGGAPGGVALDQQRPAALHQLDAILVDIGSGDGGRATDAHVVVVRAVAAGVPG